MRSIFGTLRALPMITLAAGTIWLGIAAIGTARPASAMGGHGGAGFADR